MSFGPVTLIFLPASYSLTVPTTVSVLVLTSGPGWWTTFSVFWCTVSPDAGIVFAVPLAAGFDVLAAVPTPIGAV